MAEQADRGMRPQDIFAACHARYRSARRRRAHLGVPDPNQPAGYHWRPVAARAADYLADFELAGQRALARPSWAGRRRLFEIYFLQLVPYRRAIYLVGVPAGTFDWWMQQIKRDVGLELDRAGLYPPARYFRQTAAAELSP
jgi:hypothetical protein